MWRYHRGLVNTDLDDAEGVQVLEAAPVRDVGALRRNDHPQQTHGLFRVTMFHGVESSYGTLVQAKTPRYSFQLDQSTPASIK